MKKNFMIFFILLCAVLNISITPLNGGRLCLAQRGSCRQADPRKVTEEQEYQASLTPLMRALKKGAFDAILEEIKSAHHQGLLDEKDSRGQTALFHAAFVCPIALHWIIKAGASLTDQDYKQRSLFLAAAEHQKKEFLPVLGCGADPLEILLEYKSNMINEEDENGNTALHFLWNTPYKTFLLKQGADASHKNHAGRTPCQEGMDRKPPQEKESITPNLRDLFKE